MAPKAAKAKAKTSRPKAKAVGVNAETLPTQANLGYHEKLTTAWRLILSNPHFESVQDLRPLTATGAAFDEASFLEAMASGGVYRFSFNCFWVSPLDPVDTAPVNESNVKTWEKRWYGNAMEVLPSEMNYTYKIAWWEGGPSPLKTSDLGKLCLVSP